jgi:hypothetical protein
MRNSNFGFPRVLPTSSASAEPSPKRRRIGEATDPPPEMREEALERLRGVVRDSAGKHLYTSAIFLADKVAAATGDPGDVYMLAQALFLGRQFRRALHLLNNSRLLRDLRFRFLAAKCLVRLLRTPPPPPGAVSSLRARRMRVNVGAAFCSSLFGSRGDYQQLSTCRHFVRRSGLILWLNTLLGCWHFS